MCNNCTPSLWNKHLLQIFMKHEKHFWRRPARLQWIMSFQVGFYSIKPYLMRWVSEPRIQQFSLLMGLDLSDSFWLDLTFPRNSEVVFLFPDQNRSNFFWTSNFRIWVRNPWKIHGFWTQSHGGGLVGRGFSGCHFFKGWFLRFKICEKFRVVLTSDIWRVPISLFPPISNPTWCLLYSFVACYKPRHDTDSETW